MPLAVGVILGILATKNDTRMEMNDSYYKNYVEKKVAEKYAIIRFLLLVIVGILSFFIWFGIQQSFIFESALLSILALYLSAKLFQIQLFIYEMEELMNSWKRSPLRFILFSILIGGLIATILNYISWASTGKRIINSNTLIPYLSALATFIVALIALNPKRFSPKPILMFKSHCFGIFFIESYKDNCGNEERYDLFVDLVNKGKAPAHKIYGEICCIDGTEQSKIPLTFSCKLLYPHQNKKIKLASINSSGEIQFNFSDKESESRLVMIAGESIRIQIRIFEESGYSIWDQWLFSYEQFHLSDFTLQMYGIKTKKIL